MTRTDTRRVGAEGEPLVVIDDFAPDPDALRAAAAATRFGPARHHYPGLRAPLPPDYLAVQLPVVAAALDQAFGAGGRTRLIDASFSLVTTPPAALTVRQRLPHCDAFTAHRIAMVHHLSDHADGTAFYRHRATGYETIDEARAPDYFGRLEAELRADPPPRAYIAGDTPLFDQVAIAEARPNRAVLYRSWLLHSGAIRPDAALSPDPARGRLTVTAFFTIAGAALDARQGFEP